MDRWTVFDGGAATFSDTEGAPADWSPREPSPSRAASQSDDESDAFEMQVNAQVAAMAKKSDEIRTEKSVTGGCSRYSTVAEVDSIVFEMNSSSLIARRGFNRGVRLIPGPVSIPPASSPAT